MKTSKFIFRVVFSAISPAFFFSCTGEEERVSPADTADVISESLVDAYFEDTDDMTLAAISSDGSPVGGRIASDDRFCTALLFDGTNLSGSVVLNFGTACTDLRGNIRSGTIRLDYADGPAATTGFTVVMTFDGYTINGVRLEGTRTIRRLVSDYSNILRHEVTLENGRVTWPDNSTSSRNSSFVRELNLNDLTVKLDGEASGQNRRGKSYTMAIAETLLYKGDCVLSDGIYMAVQGVKLFTSGGRTLAIDYGDGSCDRMVTVKIGNAATSLAVGD